MVAHAFGARWNNNISVLLRQSYRNHLEQIFSVKRKDLRV